MGFLIVLFKLENKNLTKNGDWSFMYPNKLLSNHDTFDNPQ